MRLFVGSFMVIGLVCGQSWNANATPESRAAVLFLLIEPGARAQGMGEVGTAIANDGTAAHFNPAGIISPRVMAANLSYWNWLPGLADDLSYIHGSMLLASKRDAPGDSRIALGTTFKILNLGEQARTGESGESLGKYRSYDAMIGVTFAAAKARSSAGVMSFGATLKLIRSNLADQGAGAERGSGVANAVAMDVGFLWQGLGWERFDQVRANTAIITNETARSMLYNRMLPGLSFGVALSNLGPKIAYIDASQADPLPLNIRFGLGFTLDTDIIGFQAGLDIYKPLISDGSFASNTVTAWFDESFKDEFLEMDYHLGAEFTWLMFYSARAGYSFDWDGELRGPSVGVGIGPETARLNIACLFGELSEYNSKWRFSLDTAF